MMRFVNKTEEEESKDFRFGLELADEEQKDQAPLGSTKAKRTSSIKLETLPEAGEAKRLKKLNKRYSLVRMDHGQDQLLWGAIQRFTPEELEARRKRRISIFFLQDANGRQGLTKQTANRQLISEDSEERKITRSELEELFLERADALVSEDRINHIFLQADKDGNGFVHADDVADYINSIEPRTHKERQNCIYRSMLVSISFWCYTFFAIGSVIGVIKNLHEREYGDLHWMYGQVGFWMFQIGCLGFFFLDYDFERIEFERLQLMNQKLVRWIRRDLSRGLIEEQDSKVQSDSWVQSEVACHEDDLMNLQQMRLVLENAGVVLSYEDLIQVFTEIAGDDRKEYITMLHLIEFAEKKQKLLQGKEKHRAILHRCLKSPSFWGDFLFSVGAAAYLLSILVDATSEMAQQIGAICYFAGAVIGGICNVYKSLSRSLFSMERVNVRLGVAAVKLGMLVTVNDEESNTRIRKSAMLGVKESQISWVSEAELRKLQKVGARRLFGLVGMADDEIISPIQLYRALMDLGVYISIANCKQLYAKIAADKEGVQVSDIVYYIARISTNGGYSSPSRMSRVCKVVTAMPWHFSFWALTSLGIGSALFGILGTWNPTSSASFGSNMFLASSFGWFAVSILYVHEGYKSKAASFDLEEESIFFLKESILESTAATEDDEEPREEICRASKILARLDDDEDRSGPIIDPQLQRPSSTSLTVLERLAFLRQSAILGLIKNRAESSWALPREASQSQVDEVKKYTLSETESVDEI